MRMRPPTTFQAKYAKVVLAAAGRRILKKGTPG